MPLAEEAKRSLFAYMGEVQCSRLFFLEIVFDNAQEVFGVGKDECFEKESPFLRRAASAA